MRFESPFVFFTDVHRAQEIILELKDLLTDVDEGRSTLSEVIQSILEVEDPAERNAYLFSLGFLLGYRDAIENLLNYVRVNSNSGDMNGEEG